MRTNLKPKAYIYPLPVLIIGTYDEMEIPNAMNAAWGTVCDTNQVCILVSSFHKTLKNILLNRSFTVSFADTNNVVQADFVGIVSGNNDLHKFDKTGWTTVKSEYVNAPIIEQLSLTLECKMVSYDYETEMLIGEVVNVSVDDNILTNGKIDLSKFKPLAYDTDNHAYVTLGEKVGDAFKDGLKLK